MPAPDDEVADEPVGLLVTVTVVSPERTPTAVFPLALAEVVVVLPLAAVD